MVRADFFSGLVFVALGLGALVESLRMPRFEERAINPYTVPGLVPGALGAIILLLGAVLVVRSVRAGGWVAGGEGQWSRDPGIRRLLLAVGLCLGYAVGLVGQLPFWLATWLFVTGFVVLFEWPLAADRRDRTRRLVTALVFGGLVAAAVTFVFRDLFLVRLP